MKRFSYQAKDIRTKKIVKGTVQADNEKAAGRILVDQGYVPQKIKDADKQSFIQKFLNRVTTKDRVTFTRQFATLIGAGLPLSASLRTVAEQTENKSMKLIVEEVLASVEGGKTLAESLARYPEVFNHLYISLVEAGETGGTLDESLRRLADQQEKDASMISKIRGAMVYPAIIFVVIIAVLAFMMILVVPQVDSLYSDMGEELPGLTKFLVAMSGFFAQFWWIILIMVAVLIWVFVQFRRTEIGIRWFATAKLNMPLFKGMFQRLYMSRFTRTMQMLLAAGVSMLDAMTIYRDRQPYPHKLSDAIAAYGVYCANTHRALDDARATWELLCRMQEEQDDLGSYVNLFGYHPKYGVSGPKISSVTYRPQGFDSAGKLYELS